MNWIQDDHALHTLPAAILDRHAAEDLAEGIDALGFAIHALAGAAFVVCIGAAMTAAVYWAIALF